MILKTFNVWFPQIMIFWKNHKYADLHLAIFRKKFKK